MLKIAVCDDEKIFSDMICGLINKTVKDISACEISVFNSGEALLSAYTETDFDIIFLDIEMSGITGMETAKEIRKNNNHTIIVFFTSHQEFAIEGYEVNAFRFLVKNQPEFIYEKQFRSIMDEYSLKHKTFEVPTKNKTIFFPLNDIVYFEVIDKKIIIHSKDSEIEYCGKLSDAEKELQNDNFTKAHKSFLINISWIDTINKFDVSMKNNDTVPLSRKYKKDVVENYISYMTGR